MTSSAIHENPQPSTRRRGLVVAGIMLAMMLVSTLVESLGGALSRPYSGFQIVWTRYAVHLLFMLAVFAPRRGRRLIRTGRPGLQIGRGLLMLGMPACFLIGATQMSVSDVWAFFWIAPLLVLPLAAWILHERISIAQVALTGLGCVGAWLVTRPQLTLSPALIWPAGMALCFSLYVVLTRRLRDEDTQTNLFYTAASVWVPLTIVMGFVWQTPTWQDLGVMTGIRLLGWLLLYLLDRATELAAANRLAPMLFSQVLWTLALRVGMGGGAPGTSALVGATLLVGVTAASALLFGG